MTALLCDPDWECPRHRHAGLVDCAACNRSWCRECVLDEDGYGVCPGDACGCDIEPERCECECGDIYACDECGERNLREEAEASSEHYARMMAAEIAHVRHLLGSDDEEAA